MFWKKSLMCRAMGTVATKLGGTIQASTQRKLATVLTTALAGRTWTGKECLLRSLSDLAVSAPEILATTLAGAKEGDIDRQTLVAALMKECKKEKLEYRVIALEATGTVLSELKLDHFQVFGLSHYSLVLNFTCRSCMKLSSPTYQKLSLRQTRRMVGERWMSTERRA